MNQSSLKWCLGKKNEQWETYFKEKSVQYQIYDDFWKMVKKSKYIKKENREEYTV